MLTCPSHLPEMLLYTAHGLGLLLPSWLQNRCGFTVWTTTRIRAVHKQRCSSDTQYVVTEDTGKAQSRICQQATGSSWMSCLGLLGKPQSSIGKSVEPFLFLCLSFRDLILSKATQEEKTNASLFLGLGPLFYN